MDQFQKEQNDLIKYMVYDVFYKQRFKQPKYKDSNRSRDKYGIELFITPVCNQKCNYCYLVKYGDQLYPKDIRNKETILKNLRIYLQHLLDNDITHLSRLDLFSGEIWGMEFGNQVLNIILEYIDKGLHIDDIMIPSNSSFMTEPKIANVLDYYYKQFEHRGCIFRISASVDGLPVESISRPFKKDGLTEQLKPQEYYDTLVKTFFEHGWGLHPMIDASTIEKQKENYTWWRNMFTKFGKTQTLDWYNFIMFLEVRNDAWTDDKIKSYLDWLNFAIDTDFEDLWKDWPIEYLHDILLGRRGVPIYTKDNEVYQKHIFTPDLENVPTSYMPMAFNYNTHHSEMGCSMGTLLTVRLGDLAICPCHRTAYSKFLYGKYKVENDKIVDIEANNPFLMFGLYGIGTGLMSKCDSCAINNVCMQGCCGSQYEATGDMLYPIESVCELNFAKHIFLHEKIHKFIKLHELDKDFIVNTDCIDGVYNDIIKKNPEEIKKWQPFVEQITM